MIFVVGVQCQRPPLPAWTPPALADLITCCWADNPDDRPPFTQIVPLLQGELQAVACVAATQPAGAGHGADCVAGAAVGACLGG